MEIEVSPRSHTQGWIVPHSRAIDRQVGGRHAWLAGMGSGQNQKCRQTDRLPWLPRARVAFVPVPVLYLSSEIVEVHPDRVSSEGWLVGWLVGWTDGQH